MRVFQNRSYCTIMNRSQAFFSQRVRVSSSAHWMPGYEPVSFLAGSAELAANEALFAHCPDAPVYTAETKVLEQLTGFALTRGMLCAMHRRTLPAMEEICRNAAAWRFWKMS